MVDALISANMIIWARERVGWTADELAQKMSVSLQKLSAWESKEQLPSFNQAIELSKKLMVPLGYLYLTTPPQESVPLPDLRTISNKPLEKPSPDFLDTLYDALRKREWYRDYLIAENVPKLEFAGKFGISENPSAIADDISNTLQIGNLREKAASWEEFLTSLVRQAESSRIMVLRNSIVGNNVYRKLDVHEFRGFAICDDIAPVVFINSRDFKTAQIFTLIHELAHIWLGASGVSNLDYRLKDIEQSNKIDRICDTVASETLTPKQSFLSAWNGSQAIDDNVQRLARNFRVSAFVILRRAYSLDVISKTDFEEMFSDLLSQIRPKKKESGGDFARLLTTRNSFTFTRTLLAGLVDGSVSPKEAAGLLNIRPSGLKNIEGGLLVA